MAFGNIVVKGEKAGNRQFILLPLFFLLYQTHVFFIIWVMPFFVCKINAFKMAQSKLLYLVQLFSPIHVPHMPILSSSNSAQNKDVMSKILTKGDIIFLLSRKCCGKRRNCSLRAISSFLTMFLKAVCC